MKYTHTHEDPLRLAAGMESFQESSASIYPLAEMERRYIMMVISLCEGNIPQAARSLGISPSTLYRKLAEWEGASRRPRREDTPD